ncbi:major facilitator superfamily domain-containing protein 6 [Trichonephila inaurata madagascariensis]|uniref:Major facilitator superfamily domain-containing protein 6 n=1 Tax=Trichonephila inaurata madagascariensis TaxID=2747483 RepID=A0A8X6YD90_9ARAC|nr:major facilitator superfamily domain-containing protein 6 [Trichonephila inaurata madagascariensis]
MTFQQFLFVLTKPVIGYIADYFNRLKLLICLLVVAQAAFLFFLLLVPPLPKKCVLVDNTADNKSSLFNDEACIVYGNANGSENVPELKAINYLYFINDSSCNYSTKVPSENAEMYVRVIISPECKTFVLYSSITADKIQPNRREKEIHQAEHFTSSSSKSFPKTSCKETSNSSCTLYIRDCILCCHETKCCYSILGELNKTTVKNDVADDDKNLQSDFQTYQFWIFAFLFTGLNACINGIFTLSDTACCESIEKTGADFGKQRLWGCVGWGLFSPLGGFLNDYTGTYLATWIVFVVLSCLTLGNIIKLDLMKPHISKSILKDIRTVMNSKRFILFEIGALFSGFGLGFTWFYLLWFITSIGGSSLICGLIQTVQSFTGDIPFMFFAGWMLKKLGYFNIVTLSLLACCIRFLWYSQLQNPWMVLPIEWTHGITYGVFYATMASFAKMSAKPGTEATTQSLIFATFDGLGSGIGNIVAGIGFDYLGGHDMFFYTGVFFGCSAAISIAFTFIARNKKNYQLKD